MSSTENTVGITILGGENLARTYAGHLTASLPFFDSMESATGCELCPTEAHRILGVSAPAPLERSRLMEEAPLA